MRQDLTDINIILDRSGSMSSIKTDMEGGLNTLIEDQKKVEGSATVSLYQFDDRYEEVFVAKDIQEVEDIVIDPRGMTALLDSIGKSINSIGTRLADTDEKDRPSKVIVVIITDGYENASREYNREAIKKMINHQEEKYSWEFVFLGANQDAVHEAASFGIAASKAMTYDFNSEGTQAMMSGMNCAMRSYRLDGTGAMKFTADMKAAACKNGA